MNSALGAIDAAAPIFGLIGIGYLCGAPRWGRPALLGEPVTDALNRFVVHLALPALLFGAMVRIDVSQLLQAGFVAAYALGIAATALAAWFWPRGRRQRAAEPRAAEGAPVPHEPARVDRVIDALSASYANTGFMGIPLGLTVFGDAALPAMALCTVLTAGVQFAVAIARIEIANHPARGALAAVRHVGVSLLSKPLMLAPIAGCVIAVAHWPVPGAALRFATLLGGAASPCALVTIGLFLAQQTARGEAGQVARLTVLKLAVHPAVTAVLAFWVFAMPDLWARTAVLMSALPIGSGPFMLAVHYQRNGATSARAILVSTLTSMVTLPILIVALT